MQTKLRHFEKLRLHFMVLFDDFVCITVLAIMKYLPTFVFLLRITAGS